MKVLCILLCVAFANGFYIDNNGIHEDKIQGGDYVRIDDIPYQASLLWMRTNNVCGATIIHESWVITAAHCVQNRSHRLLSVRTGSGFRSHFGEVHRIEKIIKHDDFNFQRRINDIALLKLAVLIIFNNDQRSIEIAKPHDIPREGELMRISGFGRRGQQLSMSEVLRAAYVPVMTQALCERVYRPETISNTVFCAGNGEVNACHGDSGGPGVIRGKLYGIISFHRIYGWGIFPTVFTRMHKYYNWIEEKTELRF